MSEDRCRLIITTDPSIASADQVIDVVRTGIPYALILHQGKSEPVEFTAYCETITSGTSEIDLPVIIADETRLAGRCKADGIFFSRMSKEVSDDIKRIQSERIVGIGNLKDRHASLQVGELNPDFVFFGKLDGDIKPEAHPKNLKLAEWWASFVEIPCVVMAGSDPKSILDCAMTGAEFVAASKAIFDGSSSATDLVVEIDKMLEEQAPRFEEVAA